MMDFKEYVGQNKAAIFDTIMGYMPIKEPEGHYRAVREYSQRQGNYRRPGLLMLTGEMFSATADMLRLPAAAMQLSEDWILMHDDVEDNSEMRRGKPAIHKLYGAEIAINAGDAAHLVMWRVIKDYMAAAQKDVGTRLFDKFYDMLERTVEGQYTEMNFIYNIRSLSKATMDLYLKIVGSKTCYYSVYGPMQLGAIVAGQDEGTLGVMRSIGEPAGIAFQIVDDILDMTADEKTFGKKRYGDLYEGKLTLIMLHAYNAATTDEKRKIDAIYSKRREQKTEEEIGFLADLAARSASVDYARSLANKYGEDAKAAAEKHSESLPENEYGQVLRSAISELYTRSK